MNEVFIIEALRTPIGSFLGELSSLTAPKLASVIIKDIIKKTNISPESVQEVIMGNVLSAGIGQAPARQAALFAGLPVSVECMTINKMCGSGLKAVMLAEQAIRLGDAEVILAGGMESMSNAPYLIQNIRNGVKFGHQKLLDSMLNDGLIDAYDQIHMGNCAEMTAKEKSITREEQDDYAIMSYTRAQEAQNKGFFDSEIVPVEIEGKGGSIKITKDEEPNKVKFDKIKQLKPAFQKDGTITAANASKLNDGASVVLLASKSAINKYNLKPKAKIFGHCSSALKPVEFPLAPVEAVKKLLNITKLSLNKIDLFEVNEAFAVVTLAFIKSFDLNVDKVNIYGGAVALGHPIGASGARILTTLINQMNKLGKQYGIATLCIGGGEASAILIEKVN